MTTKKATTCCPYAEPEFCATLVAAVMLHHGPDFVLFVLKINLEDIASQLHDGSAMRTRFKGLAAKLEALLPTPDQARLETSKLN